MDPLTSKKTMARKQDSSRGLERVAQLTSASVVEQARACGAEDLLVSLVYVYSNFCLIFQCLCAENPKDVEREPCLLPSKGGLLRCLKG